MQPLFRILFLMTVGGICSAPVRAATAALRPNIIVILSDDMGFSDIGCYGSAIAPPALDALAKGGVRFAEFYNGARCCPARLATGGRVLASAPARGAIAPNPVDGLQLGGDAAGAVGDHQTPFACSGRITAVAVTLQPTAGAGAAASPSTP